MQTTNQQIQALLFGAVVKVEANEFLQDYVPAKGEQNRTVQSGVFVGEVEFVSFRGDRFRLVHRHGSSELAATFRTENVTSLEVL